MAVYLTATEFRNFTNLQTAEYSDTQLNQLINAATAEIDLRTGRTWQGVVTVSNEYYDGDGSNELWLRHSDVASVTAVSIDEDYNGVYNSVTTGYVLLYGAEGRIVLDSGRYSAIEADVFTRGYKTVKVSYTYGTAAATDFVKNLCALMVLLQLRPEPNLKNLVDQKINLLRANSAVLL